MSVMWETIAVGLVDLLVKLLVGNGRDPKTEVVRLIDAHPLVNAARDEIQDALKAKFGE